MADLPSNVQSGLVEGRYILGVADGDDVNREPDAIPAQGYVRFIASAAYLPDPTAEPDPATILPAPVVAPLDDQGYVCTPDPDDPTKAGARGVRLIATDDEDLLVQNWYWTAIFKFLPQNGVTPKIPPRDFSLPVDSKRNLTRMVDVPNSPGYGINQVEAALALATDAAEDAEESAGDAKQSAFEAASFADISSVASANAVTKAAAAETAAGSANTKSDAAVATADEAETQVGFAVDTAGVAETKAQSVVDRADAGEFKGETGDTGDKGDKGDTGDDSTVPGPQGDPGNATMRVDNTVGTRIFITDGTTEHMVSGDTEWRRIVGWSDGAVTEGTIPARITPEGTTTGGVYLMRQNNQVTLAIVDGATDGTNPTIPLPAGFRGNNSQPYPAVPFSYRIGTDYFLSHAEVGATQVRLRLPAGARLSAAGSGGYGVMATWATAQAWPTSLPGTPA